MQLDYYNWNANRSYPFVVRPVRDNGQTLSTAILQDAGFLFTNRSLFQAGVHSVQLVAVHAGYGLDDDRIALEFTTNAPGVPPGYSIWGTLSRAIGGSWSDQTSIPLFMATTPLSEAADEFFDGWAVIGEPGEFFSKLNNGSNAVTSGTIEPATIQTLLDCEVSSVNLYNKQPTQWSSPEDPTPESEILPVLTDAVGELTFEDGYNTTIATDTSNSALIVSSGVNAGKGQPCSHTFDPDMPKCKDLAMCINGCKPMSSGKFMLFGDSGIIITPHATQDNTLCVKIDCSNAFCGINLAGCS